MTALEQRSYLQGEIERRKNEIERLKNDISTMKQIVKALEALQPPCDKRNGKDGKKWHQVNPNAEIFTQRFQSEGSKTTVEFSVSPYDIPELICSYYNEVGDQVVINFKYISDSNEAAEPQQHDNLITWMLGINSGRLYGIKINANGCAFEAVRLKDAINKALEHLIEHPHHKDRQDNYRLVKESLIKKSDSIFGIETSDKLQKGNACKQS